jgi:hypothetical protein
MGTELRNHDLLHRRTILGKEGCWNL